MSGLTLGGIALELLGGPGEPGAGGAVQRGLPDASSPALDRAGQLASVAAGDAGFSWASAAVAVRPDGVASVVGTARNASAAAPGLGEWQ